MNIIFISDYTYAEYIFPLSIITVDKQLLSYIIIIYETYLIIMHGHSVLYLHT